MQHKYISDLENIYLESVQNKEDSLLQDKHGDKSMKASKYRDGKGDGDRSLSMNRGTQRHSNKSDTSGKCEYCRNKKHKGQSFDEAGVPGEDEEEVDVGATVDDIKAKEAEGDTPSQPEAELVKTYDDSLAKKTEELKKASM